MMERGDKLLEISGALEYMQNHRIDDVTTLIENVTLTNKKGKSGQKMHIYPLYDGSPQFKPHLLQRAHKRESRNVDRHRPNRYQIDF